MARPRKAVAALLLMLTAAGTALASPPRLLVETSDSGQTSVAWNISDSYASSPDLPIDEPPLARTVEGFEPEGIHLTQWTATSVLVSWQTGAPLQGSGLAQPEPYDPASVQSLVRWGTLSGQLDQTAEGNSSLVYTYEYWANLTANGEDYVYRSPILHHVVLDSLEPGATYFYSVGDEAHGWSEELNFTTPASGFPLRLGIIGDLGQTANSTATLAKLTASNPDLVLLVGDFTYADDHEAGNPGSAESEQGMFMSEPPRWDSWARMTQALLANKPLISVRGNHEIEQLLAQDNATMMSAAARYPYPQDPAVVDTGPNIGAYYLNQTGTTLDGSSGFAQYVNEGGFEPSSGYYSIDLPGAAHLVMMNTYLPWGVGSGQHAWLLEDLAKVDREQTPWLIVAFHTTTYHSYTGHFKEGDTFLSIYEDIFYANQVDLVYSGHVHAYERTRGVYKYQPDPCGPMYTLIGDGGNIEGLYRTFIDAQPQPAYCADPSLYALPVYQPIPYTEPVITLQDGQFCPSSQPAWSMYREPTFGHGVLELLNATHAAWQWVRTLETASGTEEGAGDQVVISKPPPGMCASAAAAPSPAPAPAPAPASPATSPPSGSVARAVSALALMLHGAVAAAAAMF
ncbi:hypothetical protein ABPG75_010107 [Micractinium tetrahymenae]